MPQESKPLPSRAVKNIKQLILDGLERKGLSQTEASKRIGKNQAYINQFIKRSVPKRTLPEDVREALEDLLDLAPGALKLRQNDMSEHVNTKFLPLPLRREPDNNGNYIL